MEERRAQCEFLLIRYVPDTVRNEFVNIGVLLREARADGGVASPSIRFTRDWGRVRCMDAEADTAMLEALESELQGRLLETPQEGMKSVLELIEDSCSNLLQVTESKGYLAESMAAGLDELMRVYVDPRREKLRRVRSGRAKIHEAMRSQFSRAGVWDMMRKRIPASLYTRPGDSLRIDCGYRPNGVIRMFQAVSLETDLEAAKVLAFSLPYLREGVARVEQASLELTAVIEPLREIAGPESGDAENGDEIGDNDLLAHYRFGVEVMESNAIRVMTTADLGRIAGTAREELLR